MVREAQPDAARHARTASAGVVHSIPDRRFYAPVTAVNTPPAAASQADAS